MPVRSRRACPTACAEVTDGANALAVREAHEIRAGFKLMMDSVLRDTLRRFQERAVASPGDEKWTADWSLGGESGVLRTLQTTGTINDFPVQQIQAVITQ